MKQLIEFCVNQPPSDSTFKDIFDYIQKASTVVIAGCSLYFTRFIYLTNRDTQAVDKQRDRNIQSLKTIVLDHNLKHLYTFFDNTGKIVTELKQAGLTDKQKEEIIDRLSDEFIQIRIRFIDVLLAVDEKLYNAILNNLDTLQGAISDATFDNGINLSHQPKFDSEIINKLNAFKTDTIKTLFQYNG